MAPLKESFGNTWGHSWGIRLGTRVAGGPRRRLKPALQPPQWPRLMKSSFANPPGALHGAVYRGMARHLHMKTLLENLAVLGDVASLRTTAWASHASAAVSGHPRVLFGARLRPQRGRAVGPEPKIFNRETGVETRRCTMFMEFDRSIPLRCSAAADHDPQRLPCVDARRCLEPQRPLRM